MADYTINLKEVDMKNAPKIALVLNNAHKGFLAEDMSSYDAIFATDGAYSLFKDELNFSGVIGDFDSLTACDDDIKKIHTPDQNYTDFEKALGYLWQQSYKEIDVYNASGGEQDHFLGNLNGAFKYSEKLKITFYDSHQRYFYVGSDIRFKASKGQMISLFPFPKALVSSQGLKYEMHKAALDLTQNIGIRNEAAQQDVQINCLGGGYFLFLQR